MHENRCFMIHHFMIPFCHQMPCQGHKWGMKSMAVHHTSSTQKYVVCEDRIRNYWNESYHWLLIAKRSLIFYFSLCILLISQNQYSFLKSDMSLSFSTSSYNQPVSINQLKLYQFMYTVIMTIMYIVIR